MKVLITLAEVLLDQLKHKRKSFSRSKSRIEQPFGSQSIEDLLSFLNVQHTDDNDCFVCVVIHNIDGPALRDFESQQVLSQLASCFRVRIIASIDHVNAPLCKCWYIFLYFLLTFQFLLCHGIFFLHNCVCGQIIFCPTLQSYFILNQFEQPSFMFSLSFSLVS